jgi:hypothetical protein
MKKIVSSKRAQTQKPGGAVKGQESGAGGDARSAAARKPPVGHLWSLVGEAERMASDDLIDFGFQTSDRAAGKIRKLYLDRLHEQGLPLKRVERGAQRPEQFQLAQLAAAMERGRSGKAIATELAGRALRLWNAAGRALWLEEQVDIVCRGILYFDQDDWRIHAHDLSLAFEDGPMTPFWSGDVDKAADVIHNEFLASTRRAGIAVEEAWDRRIRLSWPSEILRALFPGKGETERTRQKKFFRLVDYSNAFLERATARYGAEYKRWGVDALGFWITQAWAPLGIESDRYMQRLLRATRSNMATPKKFLEALSLSAFPPVVRWLVAMRHKQAAAAKTRR